jgi:hypothetical protein
MLDTFSMVKKIVVVSHLVASIREPGDKTYRLECKNGSLHIVKMVV